MFDPKEIGKQIAKIKNAAESLPKKAGDLASQVKEGYDEEISNNTQQEIDSPKRPESPEPPDVNNAEQLRESPKQSGSPEPPDASSTELMEDSSKHSTTPEPLNSSYAKQEEPESDKTLASNVSSNQKTTQEKSTQDHQKNYFFALILSMFFGIFGIPQFYLKGWKSGLLRLIINFTLLIFTANFGQRWLVTLVFVYPILECYMYFIFNDINAPKRLLRGEIKPHKRYTSKEKIGMALVALSTVFYLSAAFAQPVPMNNPSPEPTKHEVTTPTPAPVVPSVPKEEKEPAEVTIKYINVGQGDAILIALPEKTILIDAGPTESSSQVEKELKELGRNKIDYLIATHPDEDHIGGMADIISNNDIGVIYAPNKTNNTETYKNLLETIQKKNLKITPAVAGTVIDQTKDYKVEILWPSKDANFSDTNDYSVIIKLTFGGKTFLFTGDAPIKAIASSNPGHIDVLKVSHHGSDTGTNEELIHKLSPTYAVISYAVDNSYGHPMQSVLDALHQHSVEVWGTGADGTITITCDGKTIKVSGEKNDSVVAPAPKEEEKPKETTTSEESTTPTQTAPSETTQTHDRSQDTVYVTRTGKKYHRDHCPSFRKNTVLTEMTRGEAEANGYEPCNRCNP